MTTPLIGITTYHTFSRYSYSIIGVTEAYVQAISKAGATPVLIPLGVPDKSLKELVSRMDGVLFSGGGDVHPARYGSQPHPLVNSVDEDRDRVEITLVQETFALGMPILGICRGLQVINVALGGSLYEDLQDQLPAALKHDCFPGEARDFLAHSVKIEADSYLAGILGAAEVQVNSLHHQGIHRLAAELRPTGYAPDGVIEAFEIAGHHFGLAVQWHPEWLLAHLAMRQLFAEFVNAAKNGSQ